MGILNWFRTRRQLISERNEAWMKLSILRDAIDMFETIDSLREHVHDDKLTDDIKVLPGSDIGQGKLLVSSWAAQLLAHNLYSALKQTDSPNYLTMTLIPMGEDYPIEVVVQRKGMLSPTEKATKLEAENKELKARLAALEKDA